MPDHLPNELLIRIFGYVEAFDYASAIRMSCWNYHRDLSTFSRGWAIKRVSFAVHTCRLVCRKWNVLVLPRVFAQVTLQPTKWDSFVDLLVASPLCNMALHVQALTLSQFPADVVVDRLRTLLPALPALQQVKLFRVARVGNDAEVVGGVIPSDKEQRPMLAEFIVHDATLDSTALVRISCCLQLFSHIHSVHVSDVSFSGTIGQELPLAHSHHVVTSHIDTFNADSTNPIIVRNIIGHVNCARLPTTLSVRLAYNPSWTFALTDLLSLYSNSRFSNPHDQLSDLTLKVEPFGHYNPVLQVDIDTDSRALLGLCDILQEVTHHLKRLKLELRVYDKDHITPRKLDLILRLLSALPASLTHLVLDLTFCPEQLWEALALSCRRLGCLKVLEVAVDRRRVGKMAKIDVHPAVRWLDERGVLQLYEV
ncbi:hypothetical protein BDY19DRAFT_910595 [Irpex rosettiformis]|uniref:Uncharacterized protein n=1 Tax=Irpex rosettiformis TaxID=378272 RepID=A0ACB8TN90_9APHY|nr:hypothetical protein BDY19DRAFT_910595 [Irpex rosettiformis]